MSKPIFKSFRDARATFKDSNQLFDFLSKEMGSLVTELDRAFKELTFGENFGAKVLDVVIEGGRETVINNPFDKTPSGFIVIRGTVPWIIEGSRWDREKISFNSTYFREITVGSSIVFNAGNEEIQIQEPYLPSFEIGQQVIFRNSAGGTIPGGLSFGQPYWIKAKGGGFPPNFTLSAEKNGSTVNLTSSGSGTFRIAAYGSVKILLLR